MGFTFNNPNILFLLLLIPLYLFFYWRQRKGVAVRFSTIRVVKEIGSSPGMIFRHIPAVLRCLAIFFLVVALARPQRGIQETRITTEGIDIVLTVDISGSMDSPDFVLDGKRVSRLAAAKEVIAKFIEARTSDRIGMVVFASFAYTQCPLTIDYGVLLQLLEKVHVGRNETRTAIGSGITTSLNRLRESEAKSRVIILLTDGENNAGKIDPQTAARMAETLGVKIYTIGIGPRESYRIRGRFGQEYTVNPLDPTGLKEIAATTGGEYFPAWDTGSLERIFDLINEMEKTTGEEVIYSEYNELFPYFIALGLLALLGGVILGNTLFRRLP